MTTRIDCSEAGFSEFLLANPQLDGHADLIWQLHAVYWRNKRLGHPKAVGLLIQYARAWAARIFSGVRRRSAAAGRFPPPSGLSAP